MKRKISSLILTSVLSVFAIAVPSVTQAQQADTAIHNIRGFLPDLRFKLHGANKSIYTAEDLKGSVVLLFFGYASCPDICPTTMAHLSAVLENLGDQAEQARIVFISVDPHRDTPDVLQAYVNLFSSNALGLTGNEKEIADFARRYRVAYQIEKPDPNNPKNYEVAHSRGVYIFDKQGKARTLASDGESIDALTEAVKKLL